MACLMLLRVLLGCMFLSSHPAGATGRSFRPSRRLFQQSTGQQMIWGRCDPLDRDITGCSVQGGTCSAYMSSGPEDADVEITLGGLPVSTATRDVHLHWWAARRSPTRYNPLESPLHCTIYGSMTDAYPKFFEPAFNGGNVRVNESGQATIRVRAPSAYFVWPYLAYPNIKLRLCQNESFIQTVSDRITFGTEDISLVTGSETAGMHIINAGPFVASPSTPRPNASQPVEAIDWKALQPRPYAFVSAVEPPRRPQTTTSIGSTTAGTETTTSTAFVSSTITTTAATTSLVSADVHALSLEEARNALDLDALEFSPVYMCLSHAQLFDHFTNNCTRVCPANAVIKHGQCVHPLTNAVIETLVATWQLEVMCSPSCAIDRTNMTLHGLRLSVAGHLNVPFQEVEHVAVRFEAVTGGRLLSEKKTLHLQVTVRTGRHSPAQGTQLLMKWLDSARQASQLLNLKVLRISSAHSGNASTFTEDSSIDATNDPYTPAYDSIKANLPPMDHRISIASVGQDSDKLTPGAICGIAGSIVCFGIAWAVLLRHRQRMRLIMAREAQSNQLEGAAETDVPSKAPTVRDAARQHVSADDQQHDASTLGADDTRGAVDADSGRMEVGNRQRDGRKIDAAEPPRTVDADSQQSDGHSHAGKMEANKMSI